MIYLILAICSSALVSIVMRIGNNYAKNNMVMFAANYFVCTGLSAGFGLVENENGLISKDGFQFTLLLGAFSGVMFLVSFLLLQYNIKKNGVVLASIFMKLGVLVPTLIAIIIYHEIPGIWGIIGFVIAIVAIFVINGWGSGGHIWLLLLLLVLGGFTDSLVNIFDKEGVAAQKDFYFVMTFGVALLLCIILAAVKKQKVTFADLLCGACIGIPNYFSSRFLLLALGKIPAVVVYPAQNVGVILVVTIVGLLFFKEKLNKRKFAGLVMILAALVLLNI